MKNTAQGSSAARLCGCLLHEGIEFQSFCIPRPLFFGVNLENSGSVLAFDDHFVKKQCSYECKREPDLKDDSKFCKGGLCCIHDTFFLSLGEMDSGGPSSSLLFSSPSLCRGKERLFILDPSDSDTSDVGHVCICSSRASD